MRVAVGFDHAGFPLRGAVLAAVRAARVEALDLGTTTSEPVDFPVYVEKVGLAMQRGEAERGILVCGSGIGACIAANKMKGVWASVCHDSYSAAQGVMHDDMNLLCLGARVIGSGLADVLVQAFLSARYLGNEPGEERLARRVGEIRQLEQFGKL